MKNDPRKKKPTCHWSKRRKGDRFIWQHQKGIYISGFGIGSMHIHPLHIFGGESTLLISQIYSRHLVLFPHVVFDILAEINPRRLTL